MTQYIELDCESFWSPLYGSTINIAENRILWRSYLKSKPSIGNRFAYYNKGRKVDLKWNKKIDIRMIYTLPPYVTISPFSFEFDV